MRVPSAALCVLLAAGPGWAGKQAVIAVNGCEDGSTSTLTRALRDVLIRGGSDVQSEAETARPLGGLSRGSLADAERLLASAKNDLFDKGAYDKVEQPLRTALADLEVLGPSEARWKDIRDARTMLALLEVKLGRARDAEEELKRVLRVEPDYRPDQNLYPPSFRALADKLRAQVKKDARYPLAISSRPNGLPLFVDGRPVGLAPQTLRLPAGRYPVEASYAGRRGAPKIADLEVSGLLELDETVEGAIYPDEGPCLTAGPGREDRLSALLRTASALGVAQLVSVRFEEPNAGERYIVVSVVDAPTGQETREARVKIGGGGPPQGSIGRLADFLATGAAAAPVEPLTGGAAKPSATVPAPAVQAHAIEAAPTNSRFKPLAYAAGGAGAAALLASTYFFASASGAQGQLTRLCPSNGACAAGSEGDVGQLSTQISGQRTVGSVVAGLGAAALATGVVLYLMEPAGTEASSAALTITPTGARVAVSF